MININKDNIFKAFLAGLFSCITIGALTLLTYKTSLGLFLMTSFGSSMVLLYGFPENPFAQPKNIFFGHILTAICGMFFLYFMSIYRGYFFFKISRFKTKPNTSIIIVPVITGLII